MPILSIIVPTYNCCDYLKACISKLLELDSKNVEVIIVNDGSSDGTKEYLDSLNSHLTIIHQNNGGVANARNHALDVAQGKFIYFCDSDDEIIPSHFAKIVERLSQDEVDVVVANFRNQNRDLKTFRVYYPRTQTGLMSGPDFLIHSLENKEYGSEPVQYFFKKSLIGGTRFVEKILHEDDQIIPPLLFKAENVLVLNEEIYFRKYRLDSLSRSQDERPRNNPKDLLFVIETFEKAMQSFNSTKARKVFKTLQLRAWAMLFDFYNKVPEQKDLQILNQRPGIIQILFNTHISLKYRIRYIGRVLKIK